MPIRVSGRAGPADERSTIMRTLPLVVEPQQLEPLLGHPQLLIVDLCKDETYAQAHVPGAVHLRYGEIIHGIKPVPGLLPDEARLEALLSRLGLTPDTRVVAYDDEGNGNASRLVWTLDMVGHTASSVLNGGIFAWANENHPLSNQPANLAPGQYPVAIDDQWLATHDYVRQHLGNPGVALLDARTPEEYRGTKLRAARGGHIPGAVNLNWLDTIDQTRNYRLLPDTRLHEMLSERGVRTDQEVITYCQTHHRSAHSYLMLKHLGFPRVRGYAGSWSEWGNRTDTPIET